MITENDLHWPFLAGKDGSIVETEKVFRTLMLFYKLSEAEKDRFFSMIVRFPEPFAEIKPIIEFYETENNSKPDRICQLSYPQRFFKFIKDLLF